MSDDQNIDSVRLPPAYQKPSFRYVICENCTTVSKVSGTASSEVTNCSYCGKWGVLTDELPDGYDSKKEAYGYDGRATVYRLQNLRSENDRESSTSSNQS